MKRTLILTGEAARKAACREVLAAPDGYAVTIGEQSKKRSQEECYHAMIGDISKQCLHYGRRLDKEAWKRLLIAAFVIVLRDNARAEGAEDPFPECGMTIPSIDGTGFVQLGVPSRGFTIKQAALFIEHLSAFGYERGVRFSAREDV